MNKILVKQGKWFFVIFFAVIIFSGTFVFASPPPPVPICRINGNIQTAIYKEAYIESCNPSDPQISEAPGCPSDGKINYPAKYLLDIKISSVSYISGTTEFSTCEKLYPVGSTQKGLYLEKIRTSPSDIFEANQDIEVVIDRTFINSYKLGTGKIKIYTQDLYLGMKHPTIEKLQKDLSRDSSIYPEGLVTGYFGPLTLKAVQRFQVKYGIVSSGMSATTGYGRVGPKTRAKLNELYGAQ